ncbi:hypothetical protein PFICI_14815 [Pestalotiopsis fici W106-1]|uniref:Uncharacterized protein n=1 Tax=Pestalotiopsis fici (strain W106-1 / CGMCC3.15140) TaxID=1229662 RepID=W3WJC5_PESFW|nr:uncharacterized protein PFICI_14815 [Pestalotiopsis fici W106-1]ETS73869.1 hypothetical protein PFICI_14815 [Pestalotiopsis fici W106-1]
MEEPRNVYWVPVRRKHNLDIEADSSSHQHHHHTTTTGAGAAAAFATLATSSTAHTFTRRQVVGSGDLGASTSTTADVMSTVITAVIIFIIISTSLLGLYIWRHGRQRKPWTSSWQTANDGMGQQQMQQQGRGEEGEGEEQWISGDGIAARYAHHSYRDAPLLAWNEKSQVYERTSDVASSLGVNHVLTDDDGDYFFPPNASITHSRGAV